MQIDLTPTFAEATTTLIAVLENGTAEGKEIARAELMRYARELDRIAAGEPAGFYADDTPLEGE